MVSCGVLRVLCLACLLMCTIASVDAYSYGKQTVYGNGYTFQVPAGWEVTKTTGGMDQVMSPSGDYVLTASANYVRGCSDLTAADLQQIVHEAAEDTGFSGVIDLGKTYVGNYFGWKSTGSVTIVGQSAEGWGWSATSDQDNSYALTAVYLRTSSVPNNEEREILNSFTFTK